MIPLKDDTPRFTTPYVTFFLLGFNILIFFLQKWLEWTQGPVAVDQLVLVFGLIPVKIPIALAGGLVPGGLVGYLGTRYITPVAAFLPLLTSMFLHADWWHIIGNMWILWIFGDNVEDYLGHFTYLLFYLFAGIAGGVTQVIFSWSSSSATVPIIGASAAIAGVMGAYFVLYPRARVLTWVFFIFFVWLPAWIWLGIWFLGQFLRGAATSFSPRSATYGGVAFWAHVGGFLTGLLLIKLLPHRARLYRYSGWN
jgi:membrane associated rhomboid family serine protease